MQTNTFGLKSRRAPFAFWILGLLLVIYAAACTGQRDNIDGADAWEHLRVLRALTDNLWQPGNPAFASDLPSVRYSPYFVSLAVLCRKTGISPYSALSGVAVVNTALLVFGVWLLLGAFDERPSAAAVLFVMITLWGTAPHYANSYALTDLPWLSVNPSAFSFFLVLLNWSLLRRMGVSGWSAAKCVPLILLCAVLCTISLLDHGMTGAFGVMGYFLLALTGPQGRRRLMFLMAAVVTVIGGLLCLAWPWYSFISAVTTRQDTAYWFNPVISRLTFTVWCAPGILCALFAIPLRNRPLVRTCLIGGAASLFIGLLAIPIKSPVFARFPIPGMIFLHTAVGVFAHEAGIFRLSTWSRRLREITALHSQAAYPILQVALAVMLLFFLAPQLVDVAAQPYLGRTYLTRALHLRDLQQHPRQTLAEVLAPIGPRDVVLSDRETSMFIPGIRGRIVGSFHFELFVPGQPARVLAMDRFFSTDGTEAEREETIRQYDVKWILLSRMRLGDYLFASLLRDSAVVSQADDMVLMDAQKWIAAAPGSVAARQ
jgi:hypothetical protein